MPKVYPNKVTGELLEASKVWAVKKSDLKEEGYITDFFRHYDSQNYYILRRGEPGNYEFEKVSRAGTTNKLPKMLYEGWEIIQEPSRKE